MAYGPESQLYESEIKATKSTTKRDLELTIFVKLGMKLTFQVLSDLLNSITFWINRNKNRKNLQSYFLFCISERSRMRIKGQKQVNIKHLIQCRFAKTSTMALQVMLTIKKANHTTQITIKLQIKVTTQPPR